jgi:hypothetical protein
VKGLEVVDKIGEAEIIPQMGPTDGKPKEEIVMKTVTVSKQPVTGTSKEPKQNPHVKIEVVKREPGAPAVAPAGNK